MSGQRKLRAEGNGPLPLFAPGLDLGEAGGALFQSALPMIEVEYIQDERGQGTDAD
jgi:hypothetical protein